MILLSFSLMASTQVFTMTSTMDAAPPLAYQVAAPTLDVVSYAEKHLPHHGTLMQRADGFVYLKVDDRYIHTLFPMLGLELEGYHEPYYFRSRHSPGAHISVFYRDENVFPNEIGQSFPFTVEQIAIVKPSQTASYIVLEVKSPALEKLRKKYGKRPKLHGHEFHISIAKKDY